MRSLGEASGRLLLAAYLAMVLFPFYWMAKSAVEPSAAAYTPHLLPGAVTLANFRELLRDTPFLVHLRNSLVVAAGCTAVTTLSAALGGYALARHAWRGHRVFAQSILLSYMFPPILLGIPFFALFRAFHLINTLSGLMVAHTTLSFPFGLWLMWQFFQSLPREYEEAAWVSGASRGQALLRVVLPLTAPGLLAVAVFAFANSWNDYTLALLLVQKESVLTLPVSVSLFVQQMQISWGSVQAANVLLVLPGLLLLLGGNTYFLRGLQGGGLTG